MRKIVVPNSFLSEAAELLKQGQTVKLHIDGQSMYPFIRGGIDEVEIAPYSPEKEIPKWSCLLFRWEGKYMIHRYVSKDGDEYLMMGDGNIARIERVKREEIAGILCYIYRPEGEVQNCEDKNWLKQAERWYQIRLLRRILLPLLKTKVVRRFLY